MICHAPRGLRLSRGWLQSLGFDAIWRWIIERLTTFMWSEWYVGVFHRYIVYMMNVIQCIFRLYTYVYMPIFNVNGNHSGWRPFPHRKSWWTLRFIVALHQIPLTCPTGHDPVAMVCCFLRGERLKQVRRWSEEFDPVGDACNDQTGLHVLRVRISCFEYVGLKSYHSYRSFNFGSSCLLGHACILRCFFTCLLACFFASTYLFVQMLQHVQMCRHCAWPEFPSHFEDWHKTMRRGTVWPASHSE